MKFKGFSYEPMIVKRCSSPKAFVLFLNWGVSYQVKEEAWLHTEIVVPDGMVTDGLSVPRLARSIFDRQGRLFEVAVVHDYLYRQGEWKRRDCDRLLRDFARSEGVSEWRVQLAYQALRAFGWIAWRKHRRGEAYNDRTPTKGFSGG